jgi:WD40 repeat protein
VRPVGLRKLAHPVVAEAVAEERAGASVPQPRRPLGVIGVAFSPDSRLLVSTDTFGCVRLWDVRTGEERKRPWRHEGQVPAVAFSPDGRTVASASNDHTARLWDVDSGAEKRRLVHSGFVVAVAFSPDGHLVVTGSQDGTARLWDVKTGLPVGPAYPREVNSVAFRSDGREVLMSTGQLRWIVAGKVPGDGAGSPERWALRVRADTGLALTDSAGAATSRFRILNTETWKEDRRRLEELGGPR